MASGTLAAADLVQIRASQYVSAAGLVVLLWDHMLTFGEEVDFIWTAKFSAPKLLFLLNRYAVPVLLIFQTHEFSGIGSPYISSTMCKVGSSVVTALGMLSIATSNFLVLLRLWALWDRSRRLMFGTLILYILTQLVAISFTVYVIYDMIPSIVYNSALHVCAPIAKPKFVLLWSPGIAFELMIFLTSVWNAIDQPRPLNERTIKVLHRDGSAYFVGLFVLRLTNLLLSAFAPLSLSYLGVFFIWSVSNITLARLILNLRQLSLVAVSNFKNSPSNHVPLLVVFPFIFRSLFWDFSVLSLILCLLSSCQIAGSWRRSIMSHQLTMVCPPLIIPSTRMDPLSRQLARPVSWGATILVTVLSRLYFIVVYTPLV